MQAQQTEVTILNDGKEIVRKIVSPGDYLIGSDPSADIVIVGFETISAKHSKLMIDEDEWFIQDMESTNGTFVNGKPTDGVQRVFPTQEIRLGDILMQLRRARGAGAPEASSSPLDTMTRKLVVAEGPKERKYRIGGMFAKGGMGAILDAKDLAIRRTVAMKVMLERFTVEDLTRFIDEAQITGQLEHPNIVPVHELGRDELDHPYYTMKLVQGITLQSVLEKIAEGDPETLKRFSLRSLVVVLLRVCDAIGFANSKNIVHRDLKPENIMLGDYGEVLVMDWGLAKVIGSKEETSVGKSAMISVRGTMIRPQTMAGHIMGTPFFMAPEQARGEVDKIDARTDVYALGAILYNILTLRPPVRGQSVDEVLECVAKGKIATPTSFNSPPAKYPGGVIPLPHCPGRRIPGAISAIAMKALALEPGDRYQSAGELKADIDSWLAGYATKAEHAGSLTLLALLIKRNKGVFTTALGASLLIMTLVMIFVLGIMASEKRATENEREAVAALNDLRGTAPTFYEQALALIEKQQFKEALEKISYATSLAPEKGQYWRIKGDIEQSLTKLKPAIEAYQRALQCDPGDQMASRSLAISKRLLKVNVGRNALPSDSLRELANYMQNAGRTSEGLAMAKQIGEGNSAAFEYWRVKFQAWTGGLFDTNTFLQDPGGNFIIKLGGAGAAVARRLADLSPLEGMPLQWLELPKGTSISDLTPLARMPLEGLAIPGSKVTDLSPLKGLKLHMLDITDCHVGNQGLACLKRMPLEELQAKGTGITDVHPLAGLHLKSLDLLLDSEIGDLSPLASMPLKSLKIQSDTISDLNFLKRISLEEFEMARCPHVSDLSALVGMPLEDLKLASSNVADLSPLKFLPLLKLHIEDCPVSNLSPLSGMHLTNLILNHVPVTDLRPLKGLPIHWLSLMKTNVMDLSPLRQLPLLDILKLMDMPVSEIGPLADLPIKSLNLHSCQNITDLRPLERSRFLVNLTIPKNCQNTECLRKLPSLRRLSYDAPESGMPTMSVQDFWRQYDAGKK